MAGGRMPVAGLVLLLFPLFSFALSPDAVLLLVNEKSDASKEVANYYIAKRRIPLENVVYLRPPDAVFQPAAEIGPGEFTETIWEPANKAIRQRGLENRILAWVYSA
ncbi:MAG: hypothetical protein AAF492_19955, partial [Verrucomicrobiota bacterium]